MAEDRFRLSRNFLAQDKVPNSLFGFAIVASKKDYTEEDLAFFREHPEAGGYYDLGDGGEGEQGALEGGDALGGGPDAYVKRVNAAIADVVPFIKEHAGFRGTAYRDAVGKWTIGYGQTEIDGRPVKEGDTITEKDASAFVERRARENAALLYRQNPWTENLSQGALSALYDVAYNLGAKALGATRSPRLNSEMENADMDYDSVVWRELPTYTYAGGKELKGLVNRRNDALKRWRDQ